MFLLRTPNERVKRLFIYLLLLPLLLFNTASAEAAFQDELSELSRADLNALTSDIDVELTLHHEVADDEKEPILTAVKAYTESYYAAQGITISWAWYGSEYKYTQQWDFFTLSTHLDYEDADENHQQREVYAELFPLDNALTICYLQVGDQIITNRREELPSVLLLDTSPRTVNNRTGIDLSSRGYDELKALKSAVKDELDRNHKTDSAIQSDVEDLVEAEVESYYAAQGIQVSWPWFDYSYTCDWGCYTETTRISYKDDNGEKHDLPVYAEVFPENGLYAVYYLTIGEQTIFDNRDQLHEAASLTFMNSRKYPIAVELTQAGKYNEALAMWRSMGNYSDSAEQLDACQTIVNDQDYAAALALMNNAQFENAILAFEALNGYSDSAKQIIACRNAMSERDYSAAKALMENQKYDAAIVAFEALDGYSDASAQIAACKTAINDRDYAAAKDLMDREAYESAITAFEALNGYADSAEQITACKTAINDRHYAAAKALKDSFRYAESIAAFEDLNGYSDSADQIAECKTALASADRSITFPEDELSVFLKQKYKLEPTVTLLPTEAPVKATLLFSSSDESVAKVDKNGMITGVSAGSANISCIAEDNPFVGKMVVVHIVLPVTKVSLSDTTMELMLSAVNESLAQGTLSAAIIPENAHVQDVSWKSSNEKVATVSADGAVQALGIGRATITATSNDTSGSAKKATCTVTVTQAVESLSFDSAAGEAYVGKTEALKVVLLPKNAANKKLTWTSSNEAIATVSSAGKVKGIAPGTVTITATAASGISAEYTAAVKYAPTTMRVTAKATLIAKNSVGHKWTQEFYLNGTEFSKSTKITVEEGQTVNVQCCITENDKNPEWGWLEQDIVFTGETLKTGIKISQTVYVTENGGRYSGNNAEWLVTITFKP